MNGLFRVEGAPTFVQTYESDGSVHVVVRALKYIPQCSLFKVTFGHGGFIAVPLSDDLEEFFVGWCSSPLVAGAEKTIRIGGYISPVAVNGDNNDFLVMKNNTVVGVKADFRPANSFGYIAGTKCVMLFPAMVRKVIHDSE